MRGRNCAPCFLVIFLAPSVTAYFVHAEPSVQDEPADLIVHEWGTFLAMQGSDGAVLDGMYHKQHALPDFVHSRGGDQLRISSIRLKGETPVIYFYTERRQKVSVQVAFPAGIWTQWYPQASHVAPGLATLGSELEPRNGRISWNVEVLPASETDRKRPELPATSSDALWNFARDVDAAYVMGVDRTMNRQRPEPERFIFYRGLGRARLPLEMSFRDRGTLQSLSESDVDLLHLFIIRVENGRGAYKYLPGLKPGDTTSNVIPSMAESLPLDEFIAEISDDLASRLTGGDLDSKMLTPPAVSPHRSGLYPKEARAMVNTWRTSYFQTEGNRKES